MKYPMFAALFVYVGVSAACSSTAGVTNSGSGTCGDGVCNPSEDSSKCPADCGGSSSSSSGNTSTSTSSSSGGTSSSSSSSSSSGSTSSGTCAAPLTTADCTSCTTKGECEPVGAASCCRTGNTPGAKSYFTLIVNDAACEANGACLSMCNGPTDVCADPANNKVSKACFDCVNALPQSDPGMAKFLADCDADVTGCLDYGQCANACGKLP